MKIYKCDYCGKIYEWYEGVKAERQLPPEVVGKQPVPQFVNYNSVLLTSFEPDGDECKDNCDYYVRRIDLCPDCMKKLIETSNILNRM